jgi:hypothetical protein
MLKVTDEKSRIKSRILIRSRIRIRMRIRIYKSVVRIRIRRQMTPNSFSSSGQYFAMFYLVWK